MNVRIGEPAADGRYIIFKPCGTSSPLREWCEPSVATWCGGRWHIVEPWEVRGWIGPLPAMRVTDFANMLLGDVPPAQEFDL